MRQFSAGQRQIDFTRNDRTWIFRNAVLPSMRFLEKNRTRLVKPRDMYDVIRVLDDHGQRCWASIPTIAKEARMSRNAVVRALKGLQDASLICVEKRPKPNGGFSNQYTISWTELGLLCRSIPNKPQSPQETHDVSRGNEHRPHVGTESEREETTQEKRGRAKRFPDYSGFDFFDPKQIVEMYDATIAAGHNHAWDTFALCVVSARRRSKKSPSGLLITMLRDGWGKFLPADEDHDAVKEIQRAIGEFANT